MSATTQPYSTHLATARGDCGNAHASFFAWLFRSRRIGAQTTINSGQATSPLPILRSENAAPAPAVLRLSSKTVSQLMHALQYSKGSACNGGSNGGIAASVNQDPSRAAQAFSRQRSTSILEAKDRGFPIV